MIISEILTWEVIDNHHPIVIIDALILSDLRQLDLQAGIVKAELVQRLNGPLLSGLDAGQGVLNGLDLPQLTLEFFQIGLIPFSMPDFRLTIVMPSAGSPVS